MTHPSKIQSTLHALGRCLAALVAVGALSLAGAASAQDTADTADTAEGAEVASGDAEAGDTPDDRATSFRTVRGAETEDVPGGMLLIGAYGAIAVLLVLFLIRQQRMIAAGEARLRELEDQLRAAEGGDAGARGDGESAP